MKLSLLLNEAVLVLLAPTPPSRRNLPGGPAQVRVSNTFTHHWGWKPRNHIFLVIVVKTFQFYHLNHVSSVQFNSVNYMHSGGITNLQNFFILQTPNSEPNWNRTSHIPLSGLFHLGECPQDSPIL